MIGMLLCYLGFHDRNRYGDCLRCGYNAAGMHLRPYRDWQRKRRRR